MKAIIYANSAKIYFTTKGSKERFTFKNKTPQNPAHPQTAYIYEDKTAKKKASRKKNKIRQPPAVAVRMINSV
jgi:hypothetical protein